MFAGAVFLQAIVRKPWFIAVYLSPYLSPCSEWWLVNMEPMDRLLGVMWAWGAAATASVQQPDPRQRGPLPWG